MEEATLQEELNYYKEKLAASQDMARRTTAYLNHARSELQKKNEEIEQSIQYARHIQKNLLPDLSVFRGFFSSADFFLKQRDNIGGDIIFIKNHNGFIYFALIDCTGHGIPGALISMLAHSFFTDAINNNKANDCAAIMDSVNDKFRSFFQIRNQSGILYDSMDCILCEYNKSNDRLTYSTAGRPLWFKSGNEWKFIRSDKIAIGGRSGAKFVNHSIQMEQGDELFLFSDGVTDQFGEETNKKFMSKKLRNILSDNNDTLSLSERTALLEKELSEWQGKFEQTDDISFMALKL